MNNLFSASRKGQSAIEYLMTYGWMLLVVAIVGGAVITTVQSNQNQCSGEVPAELATAQQGFGVSDFGVGTNGAQVVLENNGQEDVTISSVNISDTEATTTDSNSLSIGDSATYTASGFSTSDSCTEVRIEVTYDQGGLTGQVLNGTIEAQVSTP